MKEQEMVTVLDQEMAVLEQEIRHLQRRQDNIRKLRGLYTGVNVLRDELGDAEVQLALTEEEMIARVKENAGRELSHEETVEHVRRDFGIVLVKQSVSRAPAQGDMR